MIIIHGEDTATSRKFFHDSKEKKKQGASFDGASVTLTDITQTVDGGDLFETEKTVFIENFLSKRKPGKEFEDIIALLNKTGFEVFLWEGKTLTKKQLSYFPKAQIKSFALPQMLFSFVDSIVPNNANLIKLFHNGIENSEPELVFFMIIRQFRLLLCHSERSEESQNQIDEVKRLAPWQSSKLKKQASLFSQKKLIELYKKLYDIDLAQKTGALPYSLVQAIDFFLLQI